MGDDTAVEYVAHISAPVAHVWAAWTNADHLCAWDPDRVDGVIDAGNTIRLTWDGLAAQRSLTVVEMLDERRLRLRSCDHGPRQELTVEVTAAEDGSVLRLEFAGFETEDQRAGAAAGWHAQIAILRHYVEEHFGEPRDTAAAFATTIASFETFFGAIGTVDGWSSWLGRTTGDPRPGGAVVCDVSAGQRWHGVVLMREAPREMVVDVAEVGVLRLRALGLDGRDPGLKLGGCQLSTWSGGIDASTRPLLRAAVQRLVAALGGPPATT